jgi:stage V sporulation protein D (sporulation-specific penicillin-binding protein)
MVEISEVNVDRATVSAKKKLLLGLILFEAVMLFLLCRVIYIQAFKGAYYQQKAFEQQTRDRLIAPRRGDILDRNGVKLASVNSVATVSVIHAQIKDEEEVAHRLADILELDYDEVYEKVHKRVALTRIKSKVDAETAHKIEQLELDGVKVDEDIQRIYPFGSLASQVIGFVGKDNQGIIGLEAKYEQCLKGEMGKIMTQTDAAGREISGGDKLRIEPVSGSNLVTSIDVNIQQYAEQTLEKVLSYKSAKRGSIIVMNPQNGEIYAMAGKPDFDLNKPFEINDDKLKATWDTLSDKEKNDALNKMWRNFNINDTYEPGSTFKVITSSAGLEEGVVKEEDTFNCGGGREVGGRYIKCWRSPRSHGSESFVQGVQNSCNPVFMDVAARLGSDKFYEYMLKFGFDKKTGIDLPGEAVGIMHKKENIGPVELATMSFGQSFQITPMQLLRAISSVVNGGRLITPHFGICLKDEDGNVTETFDYGEAPRSISEETSERMKPILESVVRVGSGNKAYIPGYRIGGKTATSEKLPRRSGKYIASFCAFAPAEKPQVIALVLIDEPQGVYYGGQVAGPVMKEMLENILPYLGVKPEYNEDELAMDGVAPIEVGNYVGMEAKSVREELEKLGVGADIAGDGDTIKSQLPSPGEKVNQGSKIILYTQ